MSLMNPIALRDAAAWAVAAMTIALTGCRTPPRGAESHAPAAAAATSHTHSGEEEPEWHYEGAEGPAHWGTLSPEFAACGQGRRQSPIDITRATPVAAVRTAFPPAELRIAHHEHVADGINNGHTIQINYPDAATLMVGGVAYQLTQYHFHSPSEHTVGGKRFPMEMHLVHKSADGTLAVVGVLIAEGAHNSAFDPVWAHLPQQVGVETHYPAMNVDVDALLPAIRTSYRYDGSLTTPPCSEGVSWIVMTTPIELSREQVAAFTHLITGNSRPVQELNGRPILSDAVAIVKVNR